MFELEIVQKKGTSCQLLTTTGESNRSGVRVRTGLRLARDDRLPQPRSCPQTGASVCVYGAKTHARVHVIACVCAYLAAALNMCVCVYVCGSAVGN